jgi:hypothetical protein
MTPAEGIGKLGFRRWYERQLIEGHMYFVSCFLAMILLAATLEQIDWRGPLLQLLYMLGVVGAAAAVCFASLRQYSFLLGRAEVFGAQSKCEQCGVYGILRVIGAGFEEPGGLRLKRSDNTWIRVRCKKCGHEWRMDNSES